MKRNKKDLLIYVGLGIAIILLCSLSNNFYQKELDKCVNGGNSLSYCQANL